MTSSKPHQYIKGWVEFYKLKFRVTPDVLIPRPETELLVDAVLESIHGKATVTVLDIGTGSGNIAISIAKNLKQLPTSQVGIRIIATDISQKALKVAKQNAKFHGVEDKIKFVKSNLLSAFCHPERSEGSSTTMKDSSLITRNDNVVILANLPYIPTARISYLDPSVKDFEPKVALDGGKDGFKLYRKLFQQISQQPQGLQSRVIICEIDYTHGELAINEAQKYFPKAEVEVKTDLAKKQRILLIRQLL